MHRAAILYDADCGFCRWALARILAWDRRRRLRPVALQSAEADRLLGPMSEESKMRSWHLVTVDGRVISAGSAVAPLARLLPWGRPVAALAAALPGATDALYRWVTRHREGLGAIVGARACSVDPSRTGFS